ncbi:CLUMA_CG018788, isoform A [Clunio marinus]|uniref:Gustatory receptor n=1 Tax=Clunio marinus TaxID=568069 RepID=A0A1J1J036_9DIPT|nr:CLUMA_CG018788, isoform A [Clunio marinus]
MIKKVEEKVDEEKKLMMINDTILPCDKKVCLFEVRSLRMSTILDAFAPLQLSSKICGYSVYTFNHLELKINYRISDVIFMFWNVANICALGYFLRESEHHVPLIVLQSGIISKAIPLVLFGSYIVYILSCIGSIFSQSKQSLLINFILQIDEMLSFTILKQLTLGFATHEMKNVTMSLMGNAFVYFWITESSSILALSFFFMMFVVKERFAKINDFIRLQVLSVENIQKLATIHDCLSEVIKLINQIYSFFLMIYIASFFLFFNLFLFGLVMGQHRYLNDSNVALRIIANITWNFHDISYLLLLIKFSASATDEGKKTLDLIFKAVNASLDEKLSERLMNFSQQIISSRLDFSCGLFKYDWSLSFKFFSASIISTYFQPLNIEKQHH